MLNIETAEKPTKWVKYPLPPPLVCDEEYLIQWTPQALLEGKNDIDALLEILRDWKGVVGINDVPLPCARETMVEFLRSRAGAERFIYLLVQATNIHNFLKMEDVLKNLRAPSAGSSTSPRVPPNGA